MEVDAAIQDERAVKFDLYTCGRLRILISFLPNMRSQMRENARPMVDESSSAAGSGGKARAVSARKGLLSCLGVCSCCGDDHSDDRDALAAAAARRP